MSKRTNFKNVFIILGVLIVLLLVIILKDRKQGDRSFRAYVVQVDTSKVDAITLTPKGKAQPLELTKKDKLWFLQMKNKQVQADNETIDALLGQISALKTKSVAATSKDKWPEYELTDSAGTRIELRADGKKLADVMVGKFSYQQPQNQNPYMRQNMQMSSYVRNSDEDEVYSVDGYISMMVNRASNSFRENAILVGKPDSWKKLTFTYPADSSFTLTNLNNKWMIDGIMADSSAVANYFSKIRMLTSNTYDDEFAPTPGVEAEMTLKVEGDNFTPIEIKAYKNNADEWVYSSSLNKENYLKSDKVNQNLFVGKQSFMVK